MVVQDIEEPTSEWGEFADSNKAWPPGHSVHELGEGFLGGGLLDQSEDWSQPTSGHIERTCLAQSHW